MEEAGLEKQDITKTYVLLTVDTEADIHQGQIIPFEQMVYCRINGNEYGIQRMMDLADRYNARMTFFVSVFEHRRMGIGPVKKICKEIDQRGHEVQLHTHPNWIYEHRFMWGYPIEKQVELIHEGKEVIIDSIGKPPIAHRAGGFGANKDTLLALKENDILIDSTFLFGNYSRLGQDLFRLNGISKYHGVVEIPVTVFKQFQIGRFHPYRPFDININSLSELIFVLEKAKENQLPVVNLLMHSFSFVHRSKDRKEIYPNLHDLRKFERLLDYINKDSLLEAIGISSLYHKLRLAEAELPYNGAVSTSGVIRTVSSACRYPNKGKANKLIASAMVCCIVLLLSIVVLVICWG